MGRTSKRRLLSARHENEGLFGFLAATNLSTSINAVTKQLSVLVVGFFAGAADPGLYRLAYELSVSLTKIYGLLYRTIFAELAKVHAGQSATDLRKLYGRNNRHANHEGVVSIMLNQVLGKQLFLHMAGQKFGAPAN